MWQKPNGEALGCGPNLSRFNSDLSPQEMKWFYNILIGIDQLGNAIIGGDPDETISSRIGKIKRKGGGKIPRWRIITRLADYALDKIDPGHSTDAIEEDEGDDAILDK